MMKTYARVESGTVVEIIHPAAYTEDDPFDADGYKAGDEIPIEKRYTPEFVSTMVDITDIDPMPDQHWSYKDGVFTPWQPPVPTEAEISAANSMKLLQANKLAASQKSALTNRISTLQDAVDNIGVDGMEDYAATPEEQAELPKRKTQLTQWKNYAIALGRVTGQSGWPLKATWPAEPKEGMDLAVSATSALSAK